MARKILLADDSVTAQNMGRKILADAGYEVIAVNNGSAALKRIAEQKPDLIVLDVYMPGYSGLEVCQRLKETNETSRIPILLTVGKLEPFKPEEAKRVRADAFIVKPFEASELLSALTKLEDKIVPHSEGSKPGRFARAIAAVEEGRYDKTVAADEDSGWKNRINFPSKKKKDKAADQEDQNDSAIYNPMNKDLRTVVERKPGPKLQEAKAQEAKGEDRRLDLGALAPEGLPKDVTPEEIAALAAAAARVTGAVVESKNTEAEPVQSAVSPSETRTAEAAGTEARTEKTEATPEAKADTRAETAVVAPSSTESPKEVTAATFAEREPQEDPEKKEAKEARTETAAEKPAEIAKEWTAAPTSGETAAVVAAPESAPAAASSSSSANGSGSHVAEVPADEPVTMAVAAGAERARASRWTAVSVALAAEEGAISLEHEMQKAHAAFAAAEAAHARPAISGSAIVGSEIARSGIARSGIDRSETKDTSSPPAVEPAAQTSAPIEPAALEPVSAREADAPRVEPVVPAVASAATETVAAGVKEFERVAASSAGQQGASMLADSTPPPAPSAEVAAQPAPVAVEAAFGVSAVQDAALEREAAKLEGSKLETPKEDAPKQDADALTREPQPREEPALDAQKAEHPAPVAVVDERSPEANETAAGSAAFMNEVPADQISVPVVPAVQPASEVTEAAMTEALASGGSDDMAKKESEIAATTAAAWASWRRIRGTGDTRGDAPQAEELSNKRATDMDEEDAAPKDAAAMAVAAGAEKAPEESPAASDSDSGEIASIVDSVLADLRPKIVEEISRKMRKKK